MNAGFYTALGTFLGVVVTGVVSWLVARRQVEHADDELGFEALKEALSRLQDEVTSLRTRLDTMESKYENEKLKNRELMALVDAYRRYARRLCKQLEGLAGVSLEVPPLIEADWARLTGGMKGIDSEA